MTRVIASNDIINRLEKMHNNKYSYPNFKYTKAKDKMKVKCPVHGIFKITVDNHLQGKGCAKCAIDLRAKNKIINASNKFINEAKEVHYGLYDYDKVNYVNAKIKVTVTCPTHGDFEITPNNHLKGYGCYKCTYERTGYRCKKLNIEDFIIRANKIHNHVYDYSKAVYISATDKLEINCLTHGPFLQTPDAHLVGKGCKGCKSSRGEALISEILKNHNVKFKREFKIPKHNYLYRYDFYIENKGILIEFHGIQHYKPIKHFGGEEKFNKTKIRDTIKQSLAKETGFHLLIIKYDIFKKMSYSEFSHRLISMINEVIKKFQKVKQLNNKKLLFEYITDSNFCSKLYNVNKDS